MFFGNSFVPHYRVSELRRWLPFKERTQMKNYLKRYHMPLAYIRKCQPFLGYKIAVRPPVLIPRPETEFWVGELLNEIPPGLRILELCTGSGCIARALANKCRSIVAIDKHPKAVRTAKWNNRFTSNVTVFQADIFKDTWIENHKHSFDLIVANPPYIPVGSRLPLSVKIWEDHGALFGGPSGTLFHQRILQIAPRLLAKNKVDLLYNVVMEIDSRREQRNDIIKLLTEQEICSYSILKDQFGRNRVLKCNVAWMCKSVIVSF